MQISRAAATHGRVADKLCILRAMSTGDNAHSSSGYYMLTGRPHQPMNFENANPGRAQRLSQPGRHAREGGTGPGGLPTSLTLPHRIFNTDGSVWPGQDAGFLGRTFDPWLLNSRLTPAGYQIQEIDLPAGLDAGRLGRRHDLLEDSRDDWNDLDRESTDRAFDAQTRRAFDLLGSSQARRAFRLEDEPRGNRELYGETPFGQSVLLARRLVESGAPAGAGQLVPRCRRATGQPLLGQPCRRGGAAQGCARAADRPRPVGPDH